MFLIVITKTKNKQLKLPNSKFASVPYFCENFLSMSQKRKHRGIAWLIFLASLGALLFAIYSHWPWLTLLLPFVATSFVYAMDIV